MFAPANVMTGQTTDRFPGAILFSACMHAAVVGALFLFTYFLGHRAVEPVKVFEMVAGDGDNFGATEAPALGVTGGVGVTVPEIKQAAPEPRPAIVPQSAPMEAVPVAPEPVLTKAPPVKAQPTKVPLVKAPDAVPDLSKIVKKTADRNEARIEKKYKAADAKKAKEDAAKKAKDDAVKAKMSKADFDKANKSKATTASPAAGVKVARIDGEGIAKGVIGGSKANKIGGAGGPALTRETSSAMEAWESMLKQRLKENLDRPPALSDTLVATAVVRIGGDGSLTGARISRTSGSAEFDQAVLDAIAKTSMPARPDGKTESLSIPFRMRDEAI